MSKLNQIQNALKELEGGVFQKLVDSYLSHKGYGNLNPMGSLIGSNKTRKGTPDTYIRQESGKFVFVEYTTQQSGAVEKFKDDFEKCIDESKTGVAIKAIERVFFCHTSKFTPEETLELHNIGRKHGIDVECFGLESISFDLCSQYPGLARDFLGIALDTGQVLTPDDFVTSYDKSQYATPLRTDFYFREEELKQALAHLEGNELLLVSGAAGVGKSRLALEVIGQFIKTHPDYKAFCIRDRGQDLFDDLKVYFSRSGNFIILVDDANRIGKFDYVVHLLQDKRHDQQIKIIATVRDYAVDKVKRSAAPLQHIAEITLVPFEKQRIKELLQKLYNIQNDIWLERITQIAGGNPRLAVMAAQIAIQDNNLNSINDVSSLYDKYFDSINEDLKALNDSTILKVAGIISLFRTVDKSNEYVMGAIQNIFGIDLQTFWSAAQRLHEYELVDIFENEVVKISDQVVATYLFYLCVFKTETISLEILLEKLFPTQRSRIRDSIYPCLNSFNFEELVLLLRPAVKNRFAYYIQQAEPENLQLLLRTFWFILRTETLEYIRDSIHAMEVQPVALYQVEWEPSKSSLQSFLSLLACFSNVEDGEFRSVLELVYRYAYKRQQEIPDVLRLLTEEFGIDRHAHRYDYMRQHAVIDVAIQHADNGKNILFSKLFLTLCKYYLQTQFQDTEGNDRSITLYTVNLASCSAIQTLRGKIWRQIFSLSEHEELRDDVLRLLLKYSSSYEHTAGMEIIQDDSHHLIPFLDSKLSTEQFVNCLVVQRYAKLFSRRGKVKGLGALAKKFNSPAYQLYKLLAYDLSDREDGMSFQDYEEVIKKRISSYTKKFDFNDCKKLLVDCLEISKEIGDGHAEWQFNSGLLKTFISIADRDGKLYMQMIDYYLALGDPFSRLLHPILVKKLIDSSNPVEALAVLSKSNYSSKRKWLFAYQQVLTPEQITASNLEHLYMLYRSADLGELPYDCDYLLNYQNQDPSVVVRVVSAIVERAITEPRFGHCFDYMFNPYSEVNKNLMELFRDNIDLLKRAYLSHEQVDKHADYDGHTMDRILDNDPNFLQKHIDAVYASEKYPSKYDDSREYNFLWRRKDHTQIMTNVIQAMVENEIDRGYIRGSYLERLFCVSDHKETAADIIAAQDVFLTKLIEEHALNADLMSLIFSAISHFDADRRRRHIGAFLNKNSSFSDFEKLDLEPTSGCGWSGSKVPILETKKSFLESILSLCKGADLLSHKRQVEKRIEYLNSEIEHEKKSEFMDDR